MVKKSYPINIKVGPFNCPAGKKVSDLVAALKDGETLSAKSFIGEAQMGNKYPVYIDEIKPENQYGFIQEVLDDGTPWDAGDITDVASDATYEIRLEKVAGHSLTGMLDILIDEGAAYQKSDSALDGELKDAADKAVADGLVTKKEMDARLKYMADNDVDKYLQLRIIRRYRLYNKPAHKPSCMFKDPYLTDSRKLKTEGIISEGLRAAAARNALICEGEKSVGKNVYLETIAWLLNMPMYLITFSRNMSPSSIYGEKTTDNSAAKALAEFDPEILAKADVVEEKKKFMLNFFFKQGLSACEAVRKAEENLTKEELGYLSQAARFKMLQAQSASVNIVIDQSELYDWLVDGGVLVFNEMNMAEANFFASFTNQLLDGTGFLFIPGRGEVKIHPDCVLFGTQNADYQGVEMQNEATMSRFGCLVFPQPKTIKAQIMAASAAAIARGDSPDAKLDKKFYDECENFYKQCRTAVNKGVVTNACLNIRGFVRALTAVAESSGYARLKRQIEIHVINTCPVDDRAALNATLEQIVTL